MFQEWIDNYNEIINSKGVDMGKIIIHNRTNITDNHALECACMVLDETVNKLKNVGDYMAVEFVGLVDKGEIIKRKTGYTIVIS